jgi:hypothetical protein
LLNVQSSGRITFPRTRFLISLPIHGWRSLSNNPTKTEAKLIHDITASFFVLLTMRANNKAGESHFLRASSNMTLVKLRPHYLGRIPVSEDEDRRLGGEKHEQLGTNLGCHPAVINDVNFDPEGGQTSRAIGNVVIP